MYVIYPFVLSAFTDSVASSHIVQYE